MKIIIVEDEKHARDMLEKLLLQVEPETEILAKLDTVKNTVEWLQQHTADVNGFAAYVFHFQNSELGAVGFRKLCSILNSRDFHSMSVMMDAVALYFEPLIAAFFAVHRIFGHTVWSDPVGDKHYAGHGYQLDAGFCHLGGRRVERIVDDLCRAVLWFGGRFCRALYPPGAGESRSEIRGCLESGAA